MKPQSQYRRARGRGFTLLELVVALSAGIAVAGAAYILSKASLAAFEAEARVSQAQFAATAGMSRLVADISRAGFMSNPNATDPSSARICGSKAGLTNIKGIQITKAGSTVPAGINRDPAWTTPDRIRVVGNFASVEQFEFRTIQGTNVYMTMQDGPMIRTMNAAANGGPTIAEIFRAGRTVRLVDSHGKETYRVISGAPNCIGATDCNQTTGITDITISLDQVPGSDGMVCGDWVSGGLINPVSIVDYWIGAPSATNDNISPAADALIHPTDTAVVAATQQTGDANRTELVRTEIDPVSGKAMPFVAGLPAPADIVAEYAVDLNFSASVRTAAGADLVPGNYTRLDGDDPTADFTTANTNAQDYVGIGVRLSVRARAPDEAAASPANPRARFNVFGTGTGGTATPFARVRTLTQEVSLQNLMGIQW